MDEAERKDRCHMDCNEDNLGAGILTLTNKRVAFDKTRARIMDFSKNVGDTIFDVPLNDVTKTQRRIANEKVCFSAKTFNGSKPTSLEFLTLVVG